MRASDEIGLVEALYDVTADDRHWAARVSTAIAGHLGADIGVVAAHSYPDACQGFHTEPLHVSVPSELASGLSDAMRGFSSGQVRSIGRACALSRFSDAFGTDHWYSRVCTPYLRRARVADNLTFVAFDGRQQCVSFAVFGSSVLPYHREIRHRYDRIAPHLSTAMKLRWGLGRQSGPGATSTSVAAVFDPGGSCRATFEPLPPESLRRLSDAVRERERARGPLRRNAPNEALALWTALIEGRWSLVDRLEAVGTRWVVAVRHEEGVIDPRRLTPREADVVQLTVCGATTKEVAFELGLSHGCVAAYLHSACRKLGCENRAALIRLARSSTAPVELALRGVTVSLLGEAAEASEVNDGRLSPAERAVLRAVRNGSSNAAIASERGVSVRTVANQVASILRKTGHTSRFELMLD